MLIERGHVFFVDLDPVVGKEIGGGKRRPVVVLSINDINVKPLVVTVVPGTSKPAQFRNMAEVLATPGNGLDVATYFMGHQVRAIDQSRFTSPAVGRLSATDLLRVEAAVRYSLGLL